MDCGAKKYIVPLILLLVLGPVILPAAVIAIMALEHFAFGTRHFMHVLEAMGLSPLLQALFDFLGING